MTENRRIVESLNGRIAAALERIADALELQNEFAKARSKTAEKVAKHRAGKKVTVTSQVVTEKKDEENREERTKEENREEESKDNTIRAREANSVPSAGSAESAAEIAAETTAPNTTAAESAANAATGKKTKTQTREQRTKELQPKFDEFWAAYPKGRKVDKQKCLSRFVSWFLAKGVNDDELFAKIMNGLEAWKKSRDWLKDDGEYVCAPLVWLNNARWESEVQPWTPRTDKPVVTHNFRRVVRADNAQIMNDEQRERFNKEINDVSNR